MGSRPRVTARVISAVPLLGQQSEHPLLRRHQRIQSRRLPVEVVGDGALLRDPRHR